MANDRKRKGWKEAPDHTGKAPKHKAAANKDKLSTTVRTTIPTKPIKNFNRAIIGMKPGYIKDLKRICDSHKTCDGDCESCINEMKREQTFELGLIG